MPRAASVALCVSSALASCTSWRTRVVVSRERSEKRSPSERSSRTCAIITPPHPSWHWIGIALYFLSLSYLRCQTCSGYPSCLIHSTHLDHSSHSPRRRWLHSRRQTSRTRSIHQNC